jgi:predicted ATPase/serine/threonine protein kinase
MQRPSTDQPAAQPSQLGPYRLLDVLGRGGMGVVYRGQHVRDGSQVAIKTVQGVDSNKLASIRREIYALGRLRHPGIVRILDQGVSSGLPWYAMELLSGVTLESRILEVWPELGSASAFVGETEPASVTVPMDTSLDESPDATPGATPDAALDDMPGATPDAALDAALDDMPGALSGPYSSHPGGRGAPMAALEPVLSLIHALCAPLAFLHGHGIVHRDLKPQNVFVQGDRPVLTDLGVAGRFSGALGREELTAEGQLMGTLPYMAPEQIRGELVDARADLYALGCILYFCLTGRRPFIASSLSGTAFLQIQWTPPPPSQWNPHVPEVLDRLVMQLLAKEAHARIGYAADVARYLESLGIASAPAPDLPAPASYFYRPKLAGRDAIETKLESRLTMAVERRRGAMIFIGGESGVGKTRLAMELARKAKLRRVQVATGQCLALGSADATVRSAPLYPWRDCLLTAADHCRTHGSDETERIFGDRGKILAFYEPALADLPYAQPHPTPAQLPAQAERARLFRCLREVLFAFAEIKPLVVVLDDLQWADELSIEFLAELATSDLHGRGLLVIGAYRMDELRPDLAAVVHSPGVENEELARLSPRNAAAMICDMLALRRIPQRLVDSLYQQSNGNPFFIAEYLRAAIERGILYRDSGGRWQLDALTDTTAMPLPSSLAKLIQKRLVELDRSSIRLVHAAAVLGAVFDIGLLLTTAAVDEAAAMEALEQLRVRQIFEDTDSGELRFVHDKIREIAYEAIRDLDRRVLHLRAAEAIEAGGAQPHLLPVLAHHFAKAEAWSRARTYYISAAERARAIYANNEAITFYQAAIDAAGHSDMDPAAASTIFAWLYEQLGDLLALSGRQDQARDALDVALDHASEAAPVTRARLYRKLGKTWATHLQHDRALAAYHTAEQCMGPVTAETRGDDWWEQWIQTQTDRAEIYYWMGQIDALRRQLDRIRPVVETWATPHQQAQFYYGLMLMRIRMERYQASADTVAYCHSYIAACEATGDAQIIASSQFSGGFFHLWHGDLHTAARYLDTAIDAAERTGNMILLSRSLTYRTVVHRMRHEAEATRAMAARSLSVATASGMRDYMGAAEANLAWSEWHAGQARKDIEQHCRAALGYWQELATPFPFEWTARLLLLVVALDSGRLQTAIAEVRALLDGKQYRFPAVLDNRLEQAMSAWDGYDPDAARSHLDGFVHGAQRGGYL